MKFLGGKCLNLQKLRKEPDNINFLIIKHYPKSSTSFAVAQKKTLDATEEFLEAKNIMILLSTIFFRDPRYPSWKLHRRDKFCSEEPILGWGPRHGYVFQKAYLGNCNTK